MWDTDKTTEIIDADKKQPIQGTWGYDLNNDNYGYKDITIEDDDDVEIIDINDFKSKINEYIKDNYSSDAHKKGFYITIDGIISINPEDLAYSEIPNDAQIHIFSNK